MDPKTINPAEAVISLLELILERMDYCNQQANKLIKNGNPYTRDGGLIEGERAAIENERQLWYNKLKEFRVTNIVLPHE